MLRSCCNLFSRCLLEANTSDEKVEFASARSSAILATLTEGISKLSGPRWVQKVDNLKSSRRNVSEIKLKRTDTTLDLSQKAKRAKEEKRGEEIARNL